MAPEVKIAKNSKLPKLSENYLEPVGKGGWPPISIWIILSHINSQKLHVHTIVLEKIVSTTKQQPIFKPVLDQ
jgi:hypothetical protein